MRIVGNLDVEVTWARMDAAARRARGEKAPSPDDPRFALPETVMRKISAAATLLRVFAESDDDVLWTPRPVDPSRMARVEWLPTPRLASGPVPESGGCWWGAPTERAAAVNDRAFAHCIAERSGLGVPGAAIVTSLDELRKRAANCGPWVAKAPFSAAGRLRALSPDGSFDDGPDRSAARLLEIYGRVRFEPWVRRTRDLGVVAWVEPRRAEVEGTHVVDVDGGGRFTGIQVDDAAPESPEDEPILGAAGAVGRELDLAGYSGPFGIDAYRWIDGAGRERLVALGEVNARLTFGRVARALADRLLDSRVDDDESTALTLRFGRGAPPSDAIPLLLPGADDDTCAWLETSLRHGA